MLLRIENMYVHNNFLCVQVSDQYQLRHVPMDTSQYTVEWPGGQFAPVHRMKPYRGRRNLALLFLDLGNRWKWVVKFHATGASSPGKNNASYSMWGWINRWSWLCGEKINTLSLSGFEDRIFNFQPVCDAQSVSSALWRVVLVQSK